MVNGSRESKISIKELSQYVKKLIYDSGDMYWNRKLETDRAANIHVAIMVQPYLSRIMSGEKTIESRYSINKMPPYGKIKTGDIVLLKKTGGEVEAVFEAGMVRYFSISGASDLHKIKQQYNNRLKIDDAFWARKKSCKYATLVDIDNLVSLPHFKIDKKSRTAWMIIGEIDSQKEVIQMELGNYPNIICVSGEIGSGKTYTSTEIANRFGWKRVSTSEFLRYTLSKQGILSPMREQLQEQGEREIKAGWNAFANSFLQFAVANMNTDCLIIDGVRHKEFYEKIKKIVSPSETKLIYLNVSEDKILKQLADRGEAFIKMPHIAEGNLSELMQAADFISDGNIDAIERFVSNHL